MFQKLIWNLIKHNSAYFIVHFQDIIHFNTEDDFNKNEAVTFLNDNIILSGSIILSSDDKAVILNEQNKLLINYTEYNWFIVKFRTAATNSLYTLIEKKDVDWDECKDNDKTLMLNNGNNCTLVNAFMTEVDAKEDIRFLKENIGEAVFQNLPGQSYHSDYWLLVQYSTGNTNFIYEIIKANSVTWHNKNNFKTLIAYLRRNGIILQSKILKHSVKFEDVLYVLNRIHNGISNRSWATNSYYDTFKRFENIDYGFLSNIDDKDMDYYYHHDGGMLDYINLIPRNTVGYGIRTFTGMFYTDPRHKRLIQASPMYAELMERKDEILEHKRRLDAQKERHFKLKMRMISKEKRKKP